MMSPPRCIVDVSSEDATKMEATADRTLLLTNKTTVCMISLRVSELLQRKQGVPTKMVQVRAWARKAANEGVSPPQHKAMQCS